jgi:hypothetical protein
MVHLSHFWAMVSFAFLVSLGLAGLAQRDTLGRIKYLLWSLVLFIGVGVGIAWALYPFSR